MYYPESAIIASENSHRVDVIQRIDKFLFERQGKPFYAGTAADALRIKLSDIQGILNLYKNAGMLTERKVWLCPKHREEIDFVSDDVLHCPSCGTDYQESECVPSTLYTAYRIEGDKKESTTSTKQPETGLTFSNKNSPRLFISYAHDDKRIVTDWIVSILRAGGYDVWFDERLIAGKKWKQQLSDEIQHSDAFVYCMTPESIESEWCQWELAKAVEFGKPVIPVLMQARTQLSDQLKRLQYVDFSNGPTGDAVARLMGGLQQLSPAQIPSAPANPQGVPPRATEQGEKVNPNRIMRILRDPAFQAIVAVIGVVIAIVAIYASGNVGTPIQPTQQSIPSTPRITAQRNMDVREEPSANSSRIAVLSSGDYLDLLGISDDGRWYQVLLPDGRAGWVVASSSAGIVSGNLVALPVIVLTLTPTNIIPTSDIPITHTPTNTSCFARVPEGESVVIYNEPNTEAQVIGRFTTGQTEVFFASENQEWLQINYDTGRYGGNAWIQAQAAIELIGKCDNLPIFE